MNLFQFTINKNHNCSDSAEHDRNEQKMSILDFLREKGIEFTGPVEKCIDYFDEQRKRRFSSIHSTSNGNSTQSNEKRFALNSSLYHKTIKHTAKSSSQSP